MAFDMNALASGAVAGSTSALLFSPVDRALFLSHVHKRPFLDMNNFARPFQGANQLVLQRVISCGMCFPLEDALRRACPIGERDSLLHNFAAGTATGSIIAVATNPLASITYNKWAASHACEASMFGVAHRMWRAGGVRAFVRAIFTTLARDFVWGGAFTGLRHALPVHILAAQQALAKTTAVSATPLVDKATGVQLPGLVSFSANVVAAGVATAVSSPLNYARNLQYAADPARGHVSTGKIFRQLWREACVAQETSGEGRARFLARRLTIGWGTLRVSVGIAVSSQVYSVMRTQRQ